MINLPDNVRHLATAVRENRELRMLLRAAGAELGGGTVLAEEWKDHRQSTDLDFMVPPKAFDEHLQSLTTMLGNLGAARVAIILGTPQRIPVVVAARGVKNGPGDIEIVRDELGEYLRDKHALEAGPRILDVGMNAEATPYILAKKLYRLQGPEQLERDHYDILWAAYEHWKTLLKTIRTYTTKDAIRQIATRAQQNPEVLFENQDKPVLKPKAPEWKSVLAQVWEEIEKSTANQGRQTPRLPKLGGTGGGKKAKTYGE